MSKKKKNRFVKNQPEIEKKQSGPDVLFILFMIVSSIYLIIRINSSQGFNAYHSFFQIPAYLILFNTVLLLFYNQNNSFLTQNKKLILWVAGGLSLLYIYIRSFYPVLELNGDNATYLAHAQSMLAGEGFRNSWMPNALYDTSLKSIGFSILNIPFIYIFGIDNYVGLKILEFLSVLFGLYFLFRYFSKRTEKGVIFLVLASVALYPQIVHFASIIMTESPSFFLMFLALFVFEYVLQKQKTFNIKSISLIAFLALFSFFVFTVREALVALPAATGLYLLIKKEWKKAVIFGLSFALLFLGYQSYSMHLKQLNNAETLVSAGQTVKATDSFITTYLRVFAKSSQYAFKNIWGALLVISQKLVGNPDRYDYKSIFPNLLALALLGWGIWVRVRKKIPLFIYEILAVMLMAVVLLTWQKEMDPVVFSRYFYPLIPLVLYYAWTGLSSALEKYPKARIYGLGVTFMFFFAFLLSMNTNKIASVRKPYHPAVGNFIKACEWIRDNTPPDSLIATRKSSLSYIWADRKSLHYFDITSYSRYDNQYNIQFATNTLNYYDRNKVNYIVLDAFSSDAFNKILPLVQKNTPRFRVLYSTASPQNYVLQVMRPSSP